MGFSRQEYWSGLLFPHPRDLPNPEMEPASPALTDGLCTTEPPEKAHRALYSVLNFVHVFTVVGRINTMNSHIVQEILL